MTRETTTESFSDNFWSNSYKNSHSGTPSPLSFNRKQTSSHPLHPVDETPDFHDPYSHLSLFLSKQIKQEFEKTGPIQKWTIKLQEELIKKITPEFQKKFPEYRLGVAALKKIWEKILFYTQQVQGKTEALDQNGKLNINFFIKENLKQYFQQKAISFIHPYQLAHQIASKMSECIATLEGTKPKLDFLTQTIWSLQKHLLKNYPLQSFKNPYDDFNKIDKLVVKTILEITARSPYISMTELEHKTKESLQALHDLPDFSSTDKITCNISAILAEKLYATSSFHTRFFNEQKEAIFNFIKRHSLLYKNNLTSPQMTELVKRLVGLYSLASQLPKGLEEDTLKEAVKAILTGSSIRPNLPQSIYAFISAELLLCNAICLQTKEEEIQTSLLEAYQGASLLPSFNYEDKELLEMLIWKTLSETEGFLEKLPYRIGQKIEEEIASILIEDPSKAFSSIVHEACQFFKRAKELTEDKKWEESDKKIHLWCLQSDMLCRSIQLNTDTPLANLIKQKWSQLEGICSPSSFVNEVCQEFLKKFPSTTFYISHLSSRTWTLYKYLWFTSFSSPDESSFDRFLKWHIQFLKDKNSRSEILVKQLEEICKKSLPLMPFDPEHALTLLSSLQEKKYA